MPALLTIASSGPTSLRHRATESSLVTSSTCAWMPSNPLNAATSVATTECPRLASSCAVAIPMPRAAPVIKTRSAFDIRKSLSCVAEHFESFIQMTFPISHADWAGESPHGNSPLGYGELRRKNLWLFVAGSVTEMKLLLVERGAATADQPFESKRFVFS